MSGRPWALWYRPTGVKRARWAVVARVGSFGEGVGLIGLGDRRHGDWIVLPGGKHPNQCGVKEWELGKPERGPAVG